MISKYITPSIVKLIHGLNKVFNGRIVFCGSFGLVYNNKLDREIGDIDAITFDNYYGGDENVVRWQNGINGFTRIPGESGSFSMDDRTVLCFRLEHDNKSMLPTDIMYVMGNYMPKYTEVDFHGTMIKIENPDGAIFAKKQYIDSPQLENRDKHKTDIEKIGIGGDDLPF